MNYDDQKIDDAVLALLAAFCADDGHSWKNFDFEVLNRLHSRGFIENPVNKSKAVYLSDEGIERGKKLAASLFGGAPANAS